MLLGFGDAAKNPRKTHTCCVPPLCCSLVVLVEKKSFARSKSNGCLLTNRNRVICQNKSRSLTHKKKQSAEEFATLADGAILRGAVSPKTHQPYQKHTIYIYIYNEYKCIYIVICANIHWQKTTMKFPSNIRILMVLMAPSFVYLFRCIE